MSDQFDVYHLWLGIPPEEQPPNHYRLLGLRPFEGNLDVISNAADQRRSHLRTFQTGKRAAQSQQLLNEVSTACVCLLDPVRKREYDDALRASLQTPAPLAPIPVSTTPVYQALPVAQAMPGTASASGHFGVSYPGTISSGSPGPIVAQPLLVEIPAQPLSAMAIDARPATKRANLAALAIAAVVGGGCLLILFAGGTAWWLSRGKAPAVVSVPPSASSQQVSTRPSTNRPIESPRETSAPSPPAIGETSPASGNPSSSPATSNPPLPVPSPSNPSQPNPTPPAPVSRLAWLPAGNADYAIRNANGQWIEFRSANQFAFDRGPQTTEYVHLIDRLRGIELRLWNDRVELKARRQEWATLDRGNWVSETDLPDFAKRPAEVQAATSLPRTMASSHALVFCGHESLRIPVPREIQDGSADFTVEAWLRVDRFEPAGILWATENGSLEVATRNFLSGSAGTATLVGIATGGRRDTTQQLFISEYWIHLACVKRGDTAQLFVGGKPVAPTRLADGFAMPSHLTVGANEGGMRGIVRDFRISHGARYSGQFTPDLKFAADESTLCLLQMQAAKAEVRDVSGHGNHAEIRGARWIPLDPHAQLAAELSNGSLDLLQAFTVNTEGLHGAIWKSPSGIETRSGGLVQLLLPYRPPAEYDLEATIIKQGGEGGAFIGLSIAGRPAILVLDMPSPRGPLAGILPVDMAMADTSPTVYSTQTLLSLEPATLMVKVRLEGDTGYVVTIESKGQTLARINGEVDSLDVPAEFQLPVRYGMSLGSLNARLRFTDLVLRQVKDQLPPRLMTQLSRPRTSATPNSVSSPSSPLGRPPLPIASNPQQPQSPPNNAETQSAIADRKPVPSTDELTAKIAEARAIYQEEFKQATKPAQKAALAKNIESAGSGTRNDATARYVLVDLARKVYIQAGEVADALRLARLLEREFDIPRHELLTSTVKALDDATLLPDQRVPLANAAAALADDLLAADQFERSDEISAIAVQSANRQKNADLKKEMVQRRAQINRIVKQYSAVKDAFAKLESAPSDAAANLAVGKFRCLALEDWNAGLPQLVASADGAFAPAAKLDLVAENGDAAAKLAAGEAWLALVDGDRRVDRDDKLAIQRRAKALLTGALSGLTGLDKVKAEKRLETLKDVGVARRVAAAGSASAASTGTSSPAPGDAGTALIGRVNVNNVDAGILVQYQHDYRITEEDVARLTEGFAEGASVRVELWGVLQVPNDMTVAIHQAGGSSGNGVHKLQIDNQTVSEVGDDRSKDLTTTMTLRRGNHLVHWTLTGGDLGTAELRITSANGGKPGELLPLAPDRSMEQGARAFPTKTTIKLGEG